MADDERDERDEHYDMVWDLEEYYSKNADTYNRHRHVIHGGDIAPDDVERATSELLGEESLPKSGITNDDVIALLDKTNNLLQGIQPSVAPAVEAQASAVMKGGVVEHADLYTRLRTTGDAEMSGSDIEFVRKYSETTRGYFTTDKPKSE